MKRIVEEADGYQPHLIAPEMGYRRLLQECLVLFKGPADTAVGEVHHVLRSIVASTINSDDCKNLQQYTGLKREIVAAASASLGTQLCQIGLHRFVSYMNLQSSQVKLVRCTCLLLLLTCRPVNTFKHATYIANWLHCSSLYDLHSTLFYPSNNFCKAMIEIFH